MEIKIRPMTMKDYDEVYALWMTLKGFGTEALMIPEKGQRVFETESDYQYCGRSGRQTGRGDFMRT